MKFIIYEMKNSLSRITLYMKKIRPIDLEIGKIKLLTWRPKEKFWQKVKKASLISGQYQPTYM